MQVLFEIDIGFLCHMCPENTLDKKRNMNIHDRFSKTKHTLYIAE